MPFDCEVSIIGARSARGEIAIYPLCGNVHARGILRLTRAPYGAPLWQARAAGYLKRVLEHFRYTGVLTIEFFVRRGRLIANEIAPRVHNSGHWTIEGASDQPVREPSARHPRSAARQHARRWATAP